MGAKLDLYDQRIKSLYVTSCFLSVEIYHNLPEAWHGDAAVHGGGGPEPVLHADGVDVVHSAEVEDIPAPLHVLHVTRDT